MDIERTSDGEDVRATLEGDLHAFGRIVERYQDVALRAAWLVVRDEAAAQDVCQEAFLRAHRHLGRFRADEPLRPWLLAIVTNLAKNAVRSRARRHGMLARVTQRLDRGDAASPGPARA
ncbi:MAG: sigma factor, partial [Dehalococcoidia bacterium]